MEDVYVVRALDDSDRYRFAGTEPRIEPPPPVVRYLASDGRWWKELVMASRFASRKEAAGGRARAVLSGGGRPDLAIDAEIIPLPTEPTFVERLVPAWARACVRADSLLVVALRRSGDGAPRFDAHTFERAPDGRRVMSALPVGQSADLLDLLTNLRTDGPVAETPLPAKAE